MSRQLPFQKEWLNQDVIYFYYEVLCLPSEILILIWQYIHRSGGIGLISVSKLTRNH